MKVVVNVCRLVLALTLILSGFVKAVDPIGTQYKINDYLEAWGLYAIVGDTVTLLASVLLSAIEFVMGICLLFAIRRRLVSRLALVVMAFMTVLTLWLAIANPISDCGCFGDAIKLTNWQTFWKNIVLLVCAAVICARPLDMVRFISKTTQWIVTNYSVVFIMAVSGYSLYLLPMFDFRPYHVGADIRQGMEMPEDAEQPQFETTFILEKDGEQKEFTADNYPDSTWTFIDSKTVQLTEGYVPPIHDFSITTEEGDDITEEVVGDKGYTFLLIAPHLEQADDSRLDRINEIYDYAQEQGYPFYCLTASSDNARQRWRNITGAEYPYCTTDETTLKTMIRSNPGLMLLKDGKVIRKWSHNKLPYQEVLTERLEKLEIGKMPKESTSGKILNIVMWFVLPLVLLTLADRLWAWTTWLKRKERSRKNISTLKTEKENEKENCSG